MEIITGRTGIKHVRAADDARIYRMLFGSGDYVLQDGNQLVAVKTGSNEITVSDGFLMSQGRLAGIYRDVGSETIEIDEGTSGTKREDTIVAEYNITAQGIESFSLKVLKGAPGGSYTSPSVTTGSIDDGEKHQVPLWGVRIDGYTVDDILIDYRNIIEINPIDQLYANIETYLSQMNAKVAELQTQYNTFTSNATTTFTNTINNKFNGLRPAYGQAGDTIECGGMHVDGAIYSASKYLSFFIPTKPAISGSWHPKMKNLTVSVWQSAAGTPWAYNGNTAYAMTNMVLTNASGNVSHPAVKSVDTYRKWGGIQVQIGFKNSLRKPDKKTIVTTAAPAVIYVGTSSYYIL